MRCCTANLRVTNLGSPFSYPASSSAMDDMLTARLIKWDSEKGYGFLRVGSQDVFLHIRDFAERHKTPEAGDRIRFSMGTDTRGRTCALNAVHFNDGGRFGAGDFLFLILLLCAPTLALHKLAFDPRVTIISAIGLSVVTYLIYALDKMCARARDWRIPETTLQLLALAGGWPGAFVAQRRIRHKCAKLRFQILFWLIVAAYQFAAVDFGLNWRLSRAAWTVCAQWMGH
jgi:uncharacterized membrane protein YsdA (DUF1294 family)/cold shock CspA family protein